MENDFTYTHSAERQQELDRIRSKYVKTPASQQEDKMDRLRKLDASCESLAMTAGLCIGIVGTLVFGLGMCCFLVWQLYPLGVILGILSLPMIIAAKPLYDKVLADRREKAAPEILRLTEELEGKI